MVTFKVGEKYKIKNQFENYKFSGLTSGFYYGVFTFKNGSTHIFKFNDMQK
jgi:hypothetical protein